MVIHSDRGATLLLLALLPVLASCRHTYIVGGEEADIGEFPWQLSLQYAAKDFHTCGASLLDNRHALTASHCIDSPPSAYQIVYGLHRLGNKEQGQPEIRKVSKINVHPRWDPSPEKGYPNDVTVLTLATAVDLSNKYVNVITRATDPDNDYRGYHCVISGWGDLKLGGPEPEDIALQKASMKALSTSACQLHWRPTPISASQICVLGDGGKVSACQGDSGGPLVCREDTTAAYVLVGVASFAGGDCQTYWPSVYTRVSHFDTWITETITQS